MRGDDVSAFQTRQHLLSISKDRVLAESKLDAGARAFEMVQLIFDILKHKDLLARLGLDTREEDGLLAVSVLACVR